MNVLESLLPAATALRTIVGPARPALAVPPSIQASNASTLAPATPVTPPASPPFRWARLQPVHDDTDGDMDRPSSVEKKSKAGKEKSKERVNPVGVVNENHSLTSHREGSTSKKNSMKLAVQVGMSTGTEEPGAVSGVDSILMSYTERSPMVEQDDQKHHPLEGCGSPESCTEEKDEACVLLNPAVDEDDEEEERFHETFLATFSRHSACFNAPRTPATVKLVSLELTSEESSECASGAMDHKKPRVTTPRPIARTSHSLPLIPMMQSLLAGVETGILRQLIILIRQEAYSNPRHLGTKPPPELVTALNICTAEPIRLHQSHLRPSTDGKQVHQEPPKLSQIRSSTL
ncbi:hypothetical protein BN14_00577 [Rhizoctonia solani AG-1 IB]|uniref:Uncharacterized protein n=1 Tax=Thanatephorus cucumeris (strain AG1-IB / isolate 7/3/14) TaxID=1108050 RepID=M5BKC9_THACB|nr:hypothetical protein BN14_00577 [Rhizoctonia solani AG-1 IB]